MPSNPLAPQCPSPTFYSWRIKDEVSPWRKKTGWRTLGWRMTEADAIAWGASQGYEIQCVEGTRLVMTNLGSTSDFRNGKL